MATRLQERMVRLGRINNVLIMITPRRVVCSNLSKEQGLVKKLSGQHELDSGGFGWYRDPETEYRRVRMGRVTNGN